MAETPGRAGANRVSRSDKDSRKRNSSYDKMRAVLQAELKKNHRRNSNGHTKFNTYEMGMSICSDSRFEKQVEV